MVETKYPVYFDPEKKMLYYIEWFDTGNNEIPTRVYLEVSVKTRKDF